MDNTEDNNIYVHNYVIIVVDCNLFITYRISESNSKNSMITLHEDNNYLI